jgi:uridine monophosphate synthetase
MTPGVKLRPGSDELGQQYLTPEKLIKERGTDVLLVGRGIYDAKDPILEARNYRVAGWSSYRSLLE